MKLLTIILAGLVVTAHAQTDTSITDIAHMLKPGRYVAHYMRPSPGKSMTPEMQALQAKVTKAMIANASWFRDSALRITDPHAFIEAIQRKMGLTEEEWKTYGTFSESSEKSMEVYGADTLEIIARGQQLGFRGTGTLMNLDSVRIDLAANTVLFKQKIIPLKDIHIYHDSDNPMHSPGQSFNFELDNSSIADSTNFTTMRMEKYEFHVERFFTTGKTAIAFMATKMESIRSLPSLAIGVLCLLD